MVVQENGDGIRMIGIGMRMAMGMTIMFGIEELQVSLESGLVSYEREWGVRLALPSQPSFPTIDAEKKKS